MSPSFGFVMATGILALAARQQGWPALSLLLFELGVLAWLLLGAWSVWRLARRSGEVARDLADPQRAPAFFTAVAGTGVLAGGFVPLDRASAGPPCWRAAPSPPGWS